MNEQYAQARVADVLAVMNDAWPPESAEDWDVVGLNVGDRHDIVDTVLFAVDPTMEVVDEAVRVGAQLIVTHHPLLMRGVHSVDASAAKGAVIYRLVSEGIALINAHTNADIAHDGVSKTLIEALGVSVSAPLSDPGAPGTIGPGRVGDLDDDVSLGEFAERVAHTLPGTAGGVRVAGPADGRVRRVAVCGGAGDGYFGLVSAAGADVYVTSDLRHHPASEARETASTGAGPATPYLVDVSHWAGESLWTSRAAATVTSRLAGRSITVDVAVSDTNTDPWTFRLPSGK